MTATAISPINKDVIKEFGLVVPKVITSDAQHDRYVSVLLKLERTEQEQGQRANVEELAELLTVLIEAYEEEHHPIRAASPVEVLQELVTANDLRQKDLAPLFGSESIVSEILSGKRELNKHHIERLSERFNVSPEVFFTSDVVAKDLKFGQVELGQVKLGQVKHGGCGTPEPQQRHHFIQQFARAARFKKAQGVKLRSRKKRK